MSEINKSNPNQQPNYRRRQAVAATIVGLALGTGTAASVDALDPIDRAKQVPGAVMDYMVPNPPEPNPDGSMFATDQGAEELKIYADHDTKQVKVRPGDGVDEVIQRAYGVDAPEGTNQVVQNNPEYAAQYQAVVEANGGSEELQPGKLPLPVDFYTQEEVEQMQSSNQ